MLNSFGKENFVCLAIDQIDFDALIIELLNSFLVGDGHFQEQIWGFFAHEEKRLAPTVLLL